MRQRREPLLCPAERHCNSLSGGLPSQELTHQEHGRTLLDCPETAHDGWSTGQQQSRVQADVLVRRTGIIRHPCLACGERDKSRRIEIESRRHDLRKVQYIIGEYQSRAKRIPPAIQAVTGKMQMSTCCHLAYYRISSGR